MGSEDRFGAGEESLWKSDGHDQKYGGIDYGQHIIAPLIPDGLGQISTLCIEISGQLDSDLNSQLTKTGATWAPSSNETN
jgi:hypothetical protein